MSGQRWSGGKAGKGKISQCARGKGKKMVEVRREEIYLEEQVTQKKSLPLHGNLGRARGAGTRKNPIRKSGKTAEGSIKKKNLRQKRDGEDR